MAKLSGPEEFFEVFRHPKRTDRPDAPGEPLQKQPEPQAARPDLAFPGGSPPAEGTIAVKVSSLAFAGVCALLLMILAYFAGLANAPEPVAKQPIAGGPINPDGRAQPAGGWELLVVSYAKTTVNERVANEVANVLADVAAVKACPVRVFTRDTGSTLNVVVGPFQSPQDPGALKVREAITGLVAHNKRPFKSASFVRAPTGP